MRPRVLLALVSFFPQLCWTSRPSILVKPLDLHEKLLDAAQPPHSHGGALTEKFPLQGRAADAATKHAGSKRRAAAAPVAALPRAETRGSSHLQRVKLWKRLPDAFDWNSNWSFPQPFSQESSESRSSSLLQTSADDAATMGGGSNASAADLWYNSSCQRQQLPANLLHKLNEFQLRLIARSKDPKWQKTCYGHAAGDFVGGDRKPSEPVYLLPRPGSAGAHDGPVSVKCDEARAKAFRAASNITAIPEQQEAKHHLLKKVNEAFRSIEAGPVVMTAGLLLGFWRECDFLVHDHDMDVAVFHRYLPRNYHRRLRGMGFTVRERVDRSARFQRLHDNRGLEFTLLLDEQEMLEPWPFVDVFVWDEGAATAASAPPKPSPEPELLGPASLVEIGDAGAMVAEAAMAAAQAAAAADAAAAAAAAEKPRRRQELTVYQALWYNNNGGHFWNCPEIFERLAKANFQGIEMYVPYPPEMHLHQKYGPTWTEPKRRGYPIYQECRLQKQTLGREPWQRAWDIADGAQFLSAQHSS
eukprot:TRINITY_DN22735_c0_g1_i1.p1 TRINITY_DN22735_c0_g1~~TRINITY_DN22735_c0_g1_i1.p1  ORF type:complete len:528 (-),score=132.67 TRINITY_DN22735_c0_g1_i1:105-1688(-)